MKKMSNMQTKDLVAEEIRNEILSGGIKAGEELKQELLSEMMGVSRMPVREALQLLEQEGYIERLPNRHMVVADLGTEKIKGILNMIAAMETEIIIQGFHTADKGTSDNEASNTETSEVLKAMETALQRKSSEQAAEYELNYHYALVRYLNITFIEQLFSKALGGIVSYIISNRKDTITKRFEMLMTIESLRNQKAVEEIPQSIQNYYQELFDSWNRKE